MSRLLIFKVGCRRIITRLLAQYACSRHANKDVKSTKIHYRHTYSEKQYNRKYIQVSPPLRGRSTMAKHSFIQADIPVIDALKLPSSGHVVGSNRTRPLKYTREGAHRSQEI